MGRSDPVRLAEAEAQEAVQQRCVRGRGEGVLEHAPRDGARLDVEPQAIVEVGEAVLAQLVEGTEGGVAAGKGIAVLLGRQEHAHRDDAVPVKSGSKRIAPATGDRGVQPGEGVGDGAEGGALGARERQ